MTTGDNDNDLITPQQLTSAVAARTPAQALALAVRQALRTLPLLSLWLDIDEEEALPAVLPTLRPLAAALAMALAQADHEAGMDDAGTSTAETPAHRLLPAAEEAGLLAAEVDAAIRHATTAISRATSVVANRRTQQAFMHTRNACAAAVRAAYAASTGSDARAAARALVHMAQLFDGWQAISADLAALDKADAPPARLARRLLAQPLWLTPERPAWAEEGWRAMREILLARAGEGWQVWTDWYDALLEPSSTAATPLDTATARARLQLPEAFWHQPPAMVNEAITQLLNAGKAQEGPSSRTSTSHDAAPGDDS